MSTDGLLTMYCVVCGRKLKTTRTDVDRCPEHRDRSGRREAIEPVVGEQTEGDGSGRIKMWDLGQGTCVLTLDAGGGITKSLCWGPKGRYALSAHYGQVLCLWDLETGRSLRTFEEHEQSVESASVAPGGEVAVSGSLDLTLKKWHIALGKKTFRAPVRVARAVTGEVALDLEIRFQALMKRAAERKADNNYSQAARLLEKARSLESYERNEEAVQAWGALYTCLPRAGFRWGWEVHQMEGHQGRVKSVCLSADGRQALSGSSDQTLKLWDTATGKCLRSLEGFQGKVNAVYLDRHGERALSGGEDQVLRLWDLNTDQCLQVFKGHSAAVTSVDLGPAVHRALSAAEDQTLRVWDVESGECLRVLEGHEGIVTSVRMSPDGQYAVSGSYDTMLKLWDLAAGECLRTFQGHDDHVNALSLSANGKLVLSGSGNSFRGKDFSLRLWDLSNGEILRTMEGHEKQVHAVCLSADGRTAVSGSGDHTVRLWDVADGKCLHTFQGFEDEVTAVDLSPDGQYALAGSGLIDRSLRLYFLDWALEEREPVAWEEEARPLLENFLRLHTRPAAGFLGRKKKLEWTENQFQELLTVLGQAGYGWLQAEGIRNKLEELNQT